MSVQTEVELKSKRRGLAINAMGLVSKEGSQYKIQKPSLRGKDEYNFISKDGLGKIICTCQIEKCEHYWAVRAYVSGGVNVG
jgi:hypothetical protein